MADNFTIKFEVDVTQSKVLSINIIPDTAYNYPADGFGFDNNFQGSGGAFVSTVGNPQLDPNNLILDQLFDERTKSQGGDLAMACRRRIWILRPQDFIKSLELGYRAGAHSAHNSVFFNAALNCTQSANPTLAYNKYAKIVAMLFSPVCQAYLAKGSGGNSPANFTTLGGITVASLGAGAAQRTIG